MRKNYKIFGPVPKESKCPKNIHTFEKVFSIYAWYQDIHIYYIIYLYVLCILIKY